MSIISPAAALLWSVLSLLLAIFLLNHLYRFDGYQSLKWGAAGKQQGRFKRLLTYSYILSVPLTIVFSITLASLKYSYGYMTTPGGNFVPVPVEMWEATAKIVLKAIYVMFSLGWALEIISHLEELNFWLYLLTTSSKPRPWLESPFFIIWCIGSVLAVIGMPTVAGFAGVDPKAEAYIFLAGSVGNLIIALLSLVVVLWFPQFMKRVRAQGADLDVLVRLSKFNELNNNRVFSRFLFVIPVMMLAVDGLSEDPYFQRHLAWMDILSMTAGVGLVLSSVLTLLIFFPRSFDYESNSPHLSRRSRRSQSMTQRQLQFATTQKQQRFMHQPKESWSSYADESMRAHRRSFSVASTNQSISFPLPVLAKHQHRRTESGNHISFEQDSGVLHRRHPYGGDREYFGPYEDDDSSTESAGRSAYKGSTVGYLDSKAIRMGVSHHEPRSMPVPNRKGPGSWVEEVSYEAMRASGLRYSEAKPVPQEQSPSMASQNTMGHRASPATLRPESSMALTPQIQSLYAALNRTPPASHEGELIDGSVNGSVGYISHHRSRVD